MPKDKKCVLVIDDDQIIQELLKFHLEREHYKVVQAYNSEEGFYVLNNNKVDLVLCDIVMDGMDGLEFCKKAREDQQYRPLPFIFITTRTSFTDKVKALEAGGDDLVTKPLDFFELLLKIQTLIKRSDIYKAYGIKKELGQFSADDPEKILLVDDDPVFTKQLSFALKQDGLNCMTAHSASEAYNLAVNLRPDLIVSDILMPEIDGYAFRKMLSEDPELHSVPFIFLTSKEGEDSILEGFNYNVVDYILKTAGPKVISAKVEAIIKSLTAERKKVVREISNAAEALRIKIVADQVPEFEGYLITQWHNEYKGIPGGDFIDYLHLDENTLAIILGDVMGKKWGAWYFAFAYAAYIRSNIRSVMQSDTRPSPASVLKQVNKCVYEDARISEIFAAISMLIIDKSKHTIKYSGAGDIPLFVQTYGSINKIYSEGVFLGLTDEGNYHDREIKMDIGDKLYLLTDGILETRNALGDQYGNRLQELLGNLHSDENGLEKMKEDFMLFSGGRAEDDISIICLNRKS